MYTSAQRTVNLLTSNLLSELPAEGNPLGIEVWEEGTNGTTIFFNDNSILLLTNQNEARVFDNMNELAYALNNESPHEQEKILSCLNPKYKEAFHLLNSGKTHEEVIAAVM